MPVTYPVDLLANFPGWPTEFDLKFRQEYSRTAGGITLAKDMGTPLWMATYQSKSLKPSELDFWKARMNSLEGSIQNFLGRPGRCYPIAYPNGTGIGNVSAIKVASLNVNNKSFRASGMPVGYKFSVGDYIKVSTTLYQVVDVTGLDIEVRPHFAPGIAVNNAVVVVLPSVPMMVLPGSLSISADPVYGRGSISFTAIETR